jgi:putative endonuclease
MDARYVVYIAELADGRLYVGVTNSIDRRSLEHRLGNSIRTTRVFGFRGIVYTEPHSSLPSARRREQQLKGWSHAKKLALANGDLDRLKNLSHCRGKKV